jgi:thiol:disulfide interchange protein DsbD
VAIILFALYYGNIAYGLFVSGRAQTNLALAPNGAAQVANGDQTLAKALVESHQTGRPIFVDFAASWCKNCEAMDFTVFNQSNVQQRLKDFIVVRYPAERPNESPARDVLNHFNVMGLPTYLILSSK